MVASEPISWHNLILKYFLFNFLKFILIFILIVERRRSPRMRNALRVSAYRTIDEKFSSLMDFRVGGWSSSSDPSGANYICFGHCKIFIS